MSKIIKIAAVSYLNTKPFIYGIEKGLNSNDFQLDIYPPAKCAEILANNEAEIGLVPVAALPDLINYDIISDYCIGSERLVDSVCLYSNVPFNQIEKVFLDSESKTSANLVKILAANYWKIEPEWEEALFYPEDKIKKNNAALIIGDKTFGLKTKFEYTYDLAAEWYNFTGLPFVFACWVSRKNTSSEKLDLFKNALRFGIDNLDHVIREYDQIFGQLIDIDHYFKNCISFELTTLKKQGLYLFLKLLSKNHQHINKILTVN